MYENIKFRSRFIKMFIFHSVLSRHRPCVCLQNKDITLRFIDKSYQNVLRSKNRELYVFDTNSKLLPYQTFSHISFSRLLLKKKKIYFVTTKKKYYSSARNFKLFFIWICNYYNMISGTIKY